MVAAASAAPTDEARRDDLLAVLQDAPAHPGALAAMEHLCLVHLDRSTLARVYRRAAVAETNPERKAALSVLAIGGPQQLAAMALTIDEAEPERLALALEDLTQPHLRLKDMMDEVLRLLKENKGEEAQQCYKEYKAVAIAPPAPDGRGKLLLDWAKDWGPKLEALCGRDGAKLREGAMYSGAFVKARAPLLQGARDEHDEVGGGGRNPRPFLGA